LSGHVYEKKLILKYIQDEGKCPVTGSPLTEQDLIALQGKSTSFIFQKELFIHIVDFLSIS
jgi:hypothetical protein